jgi:heme exporter protein A
MRLNARDLACTRGGRRVFQGLHFAVNAGEMAAITGPNGSGKSSLLRLVAGLLRPSGGEIILEGGDADASIGEQSHYVGHQDALKPSLTVAENLAFWSAFHGHRDHVAKPLACLGLASLAHLPALYLSAGQRRRLCLARLIATLRPIWLLDEPYAALDATAQAMLADIMRTHLARGGIILAAVHETLEPKASHHLRLGEANEPPTRPCPGEML